MAQIPPGLLSQTLPADEEAQLFKALMRSRRLVRPHGTLAAAVDETLAYQHPPAVPENMPSGPMPFLIEEPRHQFQRPPGCRIVACAPVSCGLSR